MNTYLLTWNPKRWPWRVARDVADLKAHGYHDGRWSCGGTKRIEKGDRLFLLQQGREPRGIIGSGYARSAPYEDRHWDDSRQDKALFVDVRFDSLLDPDREGVLPLSHLQGGKLASVNWRTQASGISINPEAVLELEAMWSNCLVERGQSPVEMPDEISAAARYFEGATRTVTVNTYERDPRARMDCIDHYGTKCSVCSFDFEATYGATGKGYIHVHHIVPLSLVGKSYIVDPIKDLRPVCPNCHAMLHRGAVPASIESLKAQLSAAHR